MFSKTNFTSHRQLRLTVGCFLNELIYILLNGTQVSRKPLWCVFSFMRLLTANEEFANFVVFGTRKLSFINLVLLSQSAPALCVVTLAFSRCADRRY